MGFATAFYNTFAKRNSVFVTTIFAGAFAFGVGFDVGVTNLWDSWNRGKQWKDIRPRYIQEGGDSE
jgi:ubiquinol-cytochrome c reductase subunit 9